MRRIRTLIALFVSLLVCACSDVPSPDDDSVTADLEEINQKLSGNNEGGLLSGAEVVNIEHKGGDSVAIATVRLPSIKPASNPEQKEVTLILVYIDDGWEIYDKGLQNPGSSTSMILRGN